MNKKVLLLVSGLILLGLAVGGIGCTAAKVPAVAEGLSISEIERLFQQTGISVSGEGKVTAVPDVAVLQLGVEAEAKTVAEAHSKAAAAMQAVMAALKEQGVADRDIQTQLFSVQPVYNWIKEERILEGYRVSNTVSAKVRELEKVGAVIDGVVAAAGDLARFDGVSFTIDDPSGYQTQAREKAMQDAIAKAEQVAALAGVTLGKATYISVGAGYVPVPRSVFGEAAPAPVTPISPGELEVSATVQVIFAIQ